MSVRFKFVTHNFVGGARILRGPIDEMQQHAATLGVAQETVAQSRSFVRAFDQTGQVGHDEFTPVDFNHAELRMQRGEWVIGDLRLCGTHRSEESGLACIWEPNQTGIGNQLQPQTDRALLAGLTRVGMTRSTIGGGFEVRVTEATIAAARNRDALTDLGEICNQRLAVFFVDLRTDRHFKDYVLAVGAGAVLAHAVTTALCLEVLLVAVIDQRIEAVDRLYHHITTIAAVAAIRSAELDEFLAPERDTAVPARAGRYVDLGFIEEFHGLRVYPKAPPLAKGGPGNKSEQSPIQSMQPIAGRPDMSTDDHEKGPSRRKVLECMTWAGTGVLWTVAGGVPTSLGIIDEALAQQSKGFTFLQISDSHMGFDKPANPNTKGTLEEAIGRVKALTVKPSFMIHTGDISHLSKPAEFDDADRIISEARLDVHYVPGEHDIIDEDQGKLYRDRYGRGTKGAGWYSFDADGVHFIGLVNVVDLKAGGLGNLGNEQLGWLEDDLKGRAASQPIVVFAHIPLWTVYPDWGWGTQDSERALGYLKRFGSVTVLNGHIHQVMQKVEGNVTFHTSRSTAFPQPAPGSAPSPGPMKVPEDKLRTMLGIASVTFKQNEQRLAIIDTPLQG